MDSEEKKNKHNWLEKIQRWTGQAWQDIKAFFTKAFPGRKAWIGAAIGSFILGYLASIILAVDVALPAGWVYFLIVLILFPVGYGLAAVLAVLIIVLLQKLFNKIPKYFLVAFIVSVLLIVTAFFLFDFIGILFSVALTALGGLLGAGIWTLAKGAWRSLRTLQKVITLTGLFIGLCGVVLAAWFLLIPGFNDQSIDPALINDSSIPSLADAMADPSLTGGYPIKYLAYGSGMDKRRSDFTEEVAIITKTVDGSDFVSDWTDLRTLLWGFDASELPLNGRVWYPDAEGEFPLVLVVHGNHLAEDYSDPGYAYLCELLASRGSICVSVDENFINSSFIGDLLGFKDLTEENDLRGWLLLEHLALWENFSSDADTPFFGKVDLSKIALIGHSRGGEAVAIAAAFNDLEHYPDNGSIEFNYVFDIQSVIAIAPVDGQYSPAGEVIPLENINYLVLQGSNDMDVNSFDGYNTFERIEFTGDEFYFKSAVYIQGANHGQFNTVWGDDDIGVPAIWMYDRSQLITEDDQTHIASVLISAFIDVTLNENSGYLPLFKNINSGKTWLPDTAYLNAYADSEMEYLLTYEEDIDLSTGSASNVRIDAHGLKRWKEDRVMTKWGPMTSNSAVYLKWDHASQNAVYEIQLTEPLSALSLEDQLVFSAAQTSYAPGDGDDPAPADFTIEVVDNSGNRASLLLSTISPLMPEIETQMRKLDFLTDEVESEAVFQTYLFGLCDFQDVNPLLDISELTTIRLIFDQTKGGEIILDNLGFKRVN